MNVGQISTFTSRWYNGHVCWPDWFVEKYQGCIHFTEDRNGPISSIYGAKTYVARLGFADLIVDIRKAINWAEFPNAEYVLVFLHEDNAVTRVRITRDTAHFEQPDEWVAVADHWNG